MTYSPILLLPLLLLLLFLFLFLFFLGKGGAAVGGGRNDAAAAATVGAEGKILNNIRNTDVVIESIAKHLWGGTFHKYPPSTFLIKGSYPAAVKAYELTSSSSLDPTGRSAHPPTILPYNDIDVFVQAPYGDRRCRSTANSNHHEKARFVESVFVRGLIPNDEKMTVQISTVCAFDPIFHSLRWSDVNAVTIGFTVVPWKTTDGTGDGNGSRVSPRLGGWFWDEAGFREFLEHKVLALNMNVLANRGGSDSPKSIVRLLRKAKQLDMKYELPNDDDLDAMLHGQFLPPNYRDIFYNDRMLNGKDRDEIERRYDLIPIPHHESFVMFARKGKPVPDFPTEERLLLSECNYSYCPGGVTVGSTLNSNSTTSNNSTSTVNAVTSHAIGATGSAGTIATIASLLLAALMGA